ncbi:MAG: nucleotidyltransferase family protein [Desulfobacteraceae bacterium]|jgi:dTDP-glucose pyrophosphorylase
MPDSADLCVHADNSIRETIECIEKNEKQIALVVDDDGRLIDTITDGDIRRAILAGLDLGTPVRVLRERKAGSFHSIPVTAPLGTDTAELLRLMEERCVRQVPLLDEQGRVAGLITLREILKSDSLPLQAVVMAGGYGKRLRPLTEDTPKAMLKVGDRPLLESIIGQLRDSGIRNVNVSTHYMSQRIAEHFGDGSDFGVEITYVEEDQPLGTAGALGLLKTSNEPILVINGDILTQVDFRAMLEFHLDHEADMTVAVKMYEHQVPYGVVEARGVTLHRIVEKPVVRRFVSAGIYLLNPEACSDIPSGKSFDMTELIERLSAGNSKVICFPVREYWMDIGKVEDYEKAQEDYSKVFKK